MMAGRRPLSICFALACWMMVTLHADKSEISSYDLKLSVPCTEKKISPQYALTARGIGMGVDPYPYQGDRLPKHITGKCFNMQLSSDENISISYLEGVSLARRVHVTKRSLDKLIPLASKVKVRQRRFATINPPVAAFNPPPVTIGVQNYLSDSKIPQGIQEAMILSCARIWAEVSGVSFQFVGGPGKTANDANILIINDGIAGEPEEVLGLTLSPDNERDPRSSTLQMRDSVDWRPCFTSPTSDEETSRPYHNTLCHEMGHALNLGHTDVADAVMFEDDGNEMSDTTLVQDDINGIVAVYGAADGMILQGGIQNPSSLPADYATTHKCIARESVAVVETTPTTTTTTTMAPTTTTTTKAPTTTKSTTTTTKPTTTTTSTTTTTTTTPTTTRNYPWRQTGLTAPGSGVRQTVAATPATPAPTPPSPATMTTTRRPATAPPAPTILTQPPPPPTQPPVTQRPVTQPPVTRRPVVRYPPGRRPGRRRPAGRRPAACSGYQCPRRRNHQRAGRPGAGNRGSGAQASRGRNVKNRCAGKQGKAKRQCLQRKT